MGLDLKQVILKRSMVLLLTGVALVTIFVVSATPSKAGFDDPDTCRLVQADSSGPDGDYVVVHRRNGFSGATVIYRDGRRLRFFTSEGVMRHEGWRARTRQIPCGNVTVREIDRIVIRMKAKARRALVIDQSGRGLKPHPGAKTAFRGPGGPLAPGAAGRGIRVELANEPRKPSYLIFAGTEGSDRIYLSRKAGLTSLHARTAGGKSLGSLIGFNAHQINLNLYGGDDFMESAGLGPDPSFYGDFYFQASGGRGDDRLMGHEGRDLMFDGGPGNDLILGRRGDDRDIGNGFGLNGGVGDDTIHGGPGDDWINGDSGEDIAYPGPGTDELYMDDGESDLIYCASDPLDYVVFDEGIDELNACPGLNYAVAR